MKKQLIKTLTPAVIALTALTGCGRNRANTIVIYTSSDENEMVLIKRMLKDRFPDLSISVEYYSTGTHAAKLKAEKSLSECDISYDLEYCYMESLDKEHVYAPIGDLPRDNFVTDLNISDNFIPTMRYGGAIIFNDTVLTKRGLSKPTCYADLLKPEYKGLISMPNPKASATGYIFLKSLVNSMGETEAFNYFDSLAKNVLAFTSSGSAPVKSLIQEEVAIALGMTSSYANYKSQGYNLSVSYFDPGSPYAACGAAIVAGKEAKAGVRDVFNYFYTDITKEICKTLYPEKIYKDEDFVVPNYPSEIPYADMSNNTPEEKERLLEKWTHM